MLKLKNFLQTKPVFLYLLPVFFVLHGFTDNFFLVPVKDALLLNAKYLAVSLLLSLLFWILYRNFYKANLVAFFIMAYNFFFGSVHDFLKSSFNNSFIIKYSFIIPASAILLLILVIYIKKTKNTFVSIAKYLNVLFLLLILLDTGSLLLKLTKKREAKFVEFPAKPIQCDTCSKPDIYLIIADEYAGKDELRDIFSFDNTSFENDLTKRGFHLINKTKSNYNWTVYSMASLLNMSYHKNLSSGIINNSDMFWCTDLIKNSNVVHFLKEKGYQIHNYSLFDLANKPKPLMPAFLPTRKALITGQTFTNSVMKDIGFQLMTQLNIQNSLNRNLYNNINVDSLTKKAVLQKSESPKFVYSHFILPHPPFYFDSNSNKLDYQFLYDEYKLDKKLYLDYLLYANKKLLEIVDYIKSNSEKPPIIILMSDHGYRQFNKSEKIDHKYYFMNINSILLPSENYSGFYDGMSNVNQFRVILNSQFGQKLPILKDSTFFLRE